MPGPHVLLSSYATRVISCGTGVLSSLSPFLGCLSGSSELGWGSVELLRTSDVSFSISECTLRPGLCLVWALWAFHAMSQWLSFQERWWVVLCFRHGFVAKAQVPPLLLGLRASLYRPDQRETIAMGDLYPLRAVRCSWSAWAAHHQRCEPFMLPQVVA